MSDHERDDWRCLTLMELASEFVWWFTHPSISGQADILIELQIEFRRRDKELSTLLEDLALTRAALRDCLADVPDDPPPTAWGTPPPARDDDILIDDAPTPNAPTDAATDAETERST